MSDVSKRIQANVRSMNPLRRFWKWLGFGVQAPPGDANRTRDDARRAMFPDEEFRKRVRDRINKASDDNTKAK